MIERNWRRPGFQSIDSGPAHAPAATSVLLERSGPERLVWRPKPTHSEMRRRHGPLSKTLPTPCLVAALVGVVWLMTGCDQSRRVAAAPQTPQRVSVRGKTE